MLYPPPLLPPRHHQFVPLITVPSLPPRANNPNFENRDGVDRGIESPGYGDGAERVMLGGESFDAYPAPPPVGSSLAPLGLQKQETLGEGMILPLPPKRSQALVSPPAPPAPGVISSCYKKRKRDLGADYESILLVIKAVCRTASHGFVYMDVEDKKGANTAGGAGQGHGGGEARPGEGREGEAAGAAPSSGGVNGLAPTLKLGHSLYEFIVRVLGESCLGKRRLTEAGFWLSLTKTVNRLQVEAPGRLRSLLGTLRWQRANRPNAFRLLVPRPEGNGEGKAGGAAVLTIHGTFPVGISLQDPETVQEPLSTTVREICQGNCTSADVEKVLELYRALWASHEPLPLARIPFLRFRRGIEVQQVLRLAGMEEPGTRQRMIAEVMRMDSVDKMLLPVTASLLREVPPRLKREDEPAPVGPPKQGRGGRTTRRESSGGGAAEEAEREAGNRGGKEGGGKGEGGESKDGAPLAQQDKSARSSLGGKGRKRKRGPHAGKKGRKTEEEGEDGDVNIAMIMIGIGRDKEDGGEEEGQEGGRVEGIDGEGEGTVGEIEKGKGREDEGEGEKGRDGSWSAKRRRGAGRLERGGEDMVVTRIGQNVLGAGERGKTDKGKGEGGRKVGEGLGRKEGDAREVGEEGNRERERREGGEEIGRRKKGKFEENEGGGSKSGPERREARAAGQREKNKGRGPGADRETLVRPSERERREGRGRT